jgi:glycerol-3-phosphate dehydrogenase
VANYARAVGFLREGPAVTGVRVEDRISSEQFDVRARVVLNAAGPWAPDLLASLGDRAAAPAPKLSRAMNVVTRAVVGSHACGGLAKGRFLFVVPWRDVSVVGTSHDPHEGGPDALAVTRTDLEAFLADAREAFPRADLTSADVRLVHRGLLPTLAGGAAHVKLLRESVVVNHAEHGAPGLVSMFGVRYTTARHTAAQAVDAVFRAKGNDSPPPSGTDRTQVFGGEISNKDAFFRGAEQHDEASPQTLRRLAITYGTAYEAVLELMRQDPALAAPLGKECPVTGAEILHAARHECAITLSDTLIRRTEAGSAGHPGTDALTNAAALLARELAWDETRVNNEIAAVESFYELPA